MPKTKVELNAEQKAWLDRVRANAAKDRHREGPPCPDTNGDPIPFYLALRSLIGKIKAARESASLSLADVAAKSGIPEDTLGQLEAGTANNPTWKIIGDYARAVGMRITVSAESAA